MKRILVLAIVLGLAVLAAPNVMAHNGNGPDVIDRDSVAYGRTYADWMAAWNQWSYSLPVTTHPLFTDGDCSVGQSGPVWFLGGAFVAPWHQDPPLQHTVREGSLLPRRRLGRLGTGREHERTPG